MFQWNYALFSSTASSLVATHLKVASGKVGLNLNIFGPNPVEHLLGKKFITIAGEYLFNICVCVYVCTCNTACMLRVCMYVFVFICVCVYLCMYISMYT